MTAEPVEKEAKNHVAQLFGRDSIYLVVWAVQLLCSALFTPVLTRILSAGDYGTVQSGIAIMQVLFIFAALGLQAAVQREDAGNDNLLGARRLIGFGVIAAGAITFTAWSTVGLWSAPLGLHGSQYELKMSVIWAGASAVTNTSLGLLRSRDRLAAFVAVGLTQSVGGQLTALALCKFIAPTSENYLLGQTVCQIGAMLIALCIFPPAFFWVRHFDFLGRALLFALPLVPSTLSTFVIESSDRLVIGANLGSEQVARYQIAYNIASMPMLLLAVLSSAWMPRFFSLSEPGERAQVLRDSRDALNRLMVPVVLGFAFGSPLILRLWVPPSYRPDDLQFVVAVVLITVVPYSAQLAVTRTLLTYGRTGSIALVNFVGAAINLVVNLALVTHLGLIGPALATLIAFTLLWLIFAWVGRDISPGRAPINLLLQLVAACGIALAAAAVPESVPVMILRAALSVGAVAWFVLVFLKIRQTEVPESDLMIDEHVTTLMPAVAEITTFSAQVPVRVPAIGRATVRRPSNIEQTAKIYYGGRYVTRL
ncbi:lipopolysaccharide biosynthesis protein [Paractinoplanes durhamensis]|uniref:Polysaccharide biosynthesis protein n=1 Tax=Paractinoplanes durhamensis TaxID=113563 RepID=A0ABQ3Z1T2_9ACTN|nr:oligosaccharide flippase family protein [Actinoplanes durhamensis]GIE03788.1 hypothetical protein Adu01nite_51380 [Actinoplanes durhamensis]